MSTVLRDAKGNEFEMRPVKCPTCGDVPQVVMGLRGGKHQRHGQGVETTIVSCSRCSLIFPNPFPFPLAPQTLYGDPAKYFAGHALAEKIAVYRALAREVAQHARCASPRILDIGAGRGDFLHAAKLEGYTDLVGLEFSSAMIDSAKQEFDLQLIAQSAEDHAASAPAPYDAVVLNAVLEHVYDPDTFIEAVAKVSKPGAALYIDVPCEPNLLTMVGNAVHKALRRPGVFNLQPTWEPYHVFGFNEKALTMLLRKHGFSVESVRVYAGIDVPSSGAPLDRLKSLVGEQLMRVANLTGTASNMFVWARRD